MPTKESNHPKLPISADDEIVISGISGRFPESNNIHELRNNLMGMRDMVTVDNDRWGTEKPPFPKCVGKIHNIEKFDTVYFGINPKNADVMDPLARMLLEHAYEAIVDAGVNPKHLRGTKTGVFVGLMFINESNSCRAAQDKDLDVGGPARALYANRISYCFDLIGPSFSLDTACSSSIFALEQAYRSMKDGLCDAAIVAGSSLCLDPSLQMKFYKLGSLSPDGRCKVWDQSADGTVRSEAVCVVFLQKAKNAKRIYATVVHSKINCDGYKEEGIHFPSRRMQQVLLKEVYEECGLPATSIGYYEAHGTGTKAGDPEEIAAIDEVLGKYRTKDNPLLIGSIKSNLGHAEPASGLCSVAKIILAMESGVIPPNLHFKNCRKELTAILQGRLKVVTELTPWRGEYAGVSNFGFGGANSHAVLRIHSKDKINNGAPNDDLPRLVVVSGRTEEAVASMLDDLASKPIDVEQLALLYSIHSEELYGHFYRGYAILPAHGVTESPVREINCTYEVNKPVLFVFSGMGSQWNGMGRDLLRIPAFSEAMKKCDAALRPLGIDIIRIITDDDKSIFENNVNCAVGIAAMQIGLVDILHSLNFEPDYIVGHSLGEVMCGYADGCFTVEQTILTAYIIGLVPMETDFIVGSMAAVGLGHEEVQKLLPPDIFVSCRNSSSSTTLSGPAESMKKFVDELKAKNIFAREVPCCNIPNHSKYVSAAGPKLLEYLKKIIPDPKPRSAKWLSTSVDITEWITEKARYCSAEYQVNNFLNPVIFEQALPLVPSDAVVIEIAPRGFFQSILKRALPATVANIPLMERGGKDNVEVVLGSIGKIFNAGIHPQIDKLYPAVAFPVSRGTPMISPMIKWDHRENWYVDYFMDKKTSQTGAKVIKINAKHRDYATMIDHIADGRTLIPASSYITLIWETFALMKSKSYPEMPVVFENVKFLKAVPIPEEEEVNLTLTVQEGSGKFEVMEGDAVVASGVVRSMSHSEEGDNNWKANSNDSDKEEYMSSRDVYKELELRGYQYASNFRNITRAAERGSKAHVAWKNDWIRFIDSLLQLVILGKDTRELFFPTSIDKIVIDPDLHKSYTTNGKTVEELEAFYDELHGVVSSGGLQIFGMHARSVARKNIFKEPVVDEYKFVPFVDETVDARPREVAKLAIDVAVESQTSVNVKTVELLRGSGKGSAIDKLLSRCIVESLKNVPLIQADVTVLRTENGIVIDNIPQGIKLVNLGKAAGDASSLIVMGERLLADDDHLNVLLRELKPEGFLLTRENATVNIDDAASDKGYNVVMKRRSGQEVFVLLRRKAKEPKQYIVIDVRNDKFDWVDKMRESLSEVAEMKKTDNTRIVFVGQDGFDNGLMGLINCLRKEPGGEIVRGILIQDPKAPAFCPKTPLYSRQLEKDLALNVLRENGVWGSYRHFPLPPVEAKPVYHCSLSQNNHGDLSSLEWREGPLQSTCNDKNLVKVAYTSLNFKDIMLGTGKMSLLLEEVKTRLNETSKFGYEYSGTHSSGKRVLGLSKMMANVCIADPSLMWEVPDKWSLEDAATIPCVYATCCYALYLKGEMKKGDKVLIHAGTGGIGQAAINLALAEGCEVFTTVSTPEKRAFIRKTFPQIRDDHIGNSRDLSFRRMINERTNGRGVDIVLNSLAKEKLLASVECLAWGGRFLEIGKYDLSSNNPLGMKCFLREVSFNGIMFDHIYTAPEPKKLELKLIIDKYLKSGAIKPLARTVFSKDQIEDAFRYMTTGKHIGKVVIKMEEENPSNSKPLAVPQYYCRENRSYLVLGGLGGFGLELCDWLVMRGARNLVITSRTGLTNGYQRLRVNLWKGYGVNVVVVSKREASLYEDCRFIVDTAAKLAPVDGIFNLAVVLRDALAKKQTTEAFAESFKAKARATRNLDLITREACPELRHFVVFSSVVCGRGNAGQSNYAMSNSVMERICERRAADGLPALAVQWGAVDDVGIVADMKKSKQQIVIAGTLPQSILSCLNKLNEFLLQQRPIVSSIVLAEKQAIADVKATSDKKQGVFDTVIKIMCLKDLKGINPNSILSDLGLDSMAAVEIKQILESDLDVFLDEKEVRNLSFSKLKQLTEDR